MFFSLTMGDSWVLKVFFYKGPIHVVVRVLTYQVDYQNKNILTLQLQGHICTCFQIIAFVSISKKWNYKSIKCETLTCNNYMLTHYSHMQHDYS